MKRIAIVGCGVVGSSWALVFARAGHEVAIYDAFPKSVQQALAFVRESLQSLPPDGGGSAEDIDIVCARLKPAKSLEEALAGADYIQESAPERLEVKRELVSQARCHRPAPRHSGKFYLGPACLILHRPSAPSRALPGRAPYQSATSNPFSGTGAGTLDGCRGG